MWNDLRLGARVLTGAPGFSIAAIAALAIGMSATITMVTVLNGMYLRDLPFEHPDRIVSIGVRITSGPPGATDNFSLPDLRDLQASARLFEGIFAADENSMDLSDGSRGAERVVGAYVSADAFDLLGYRPALGRGFTESDDRAGAPSVVMLGHRIWQRRYNGDPAIVGERVRANGVSATVIGIMPEGFGFPTQSSVWQPLAAQRNPEPDRRDNRTIDVFGKMASGVGLEQAEADLARVMERLARDFPGTNANVAPIVRPFRDITTSGPIQVVFASLMSTVLLLLLIACANVANLLLARGAARAREIAVRVSLGASRRQVVRQLLAESLVLALVAGSVGLGLAAVGVRILRLSITGTGEPYWLQFPIDGAVFASVAVICVGTAILCGLTPALHVSRVSLAGILHEAARGTASAVRARRWMDGFVIVQLALTVMLLTAAGLMVRNVVAISKWDAGVDTAGLISAGVRLPEQRYPTAEERRGFYRQLGERLSALPGMRAGITSAAPLRGGLQQAVSIEGQTVPAAGDRPVVSTVSVGPGYLEALGVGTIRGRLFTALDAGPAARVAVVNERFAALHFAESDAIGRSIRLLPAEPGGRPGDPLTVVGIVSNVRQSSLRRQNQERTAEPVVYLPLAATAPPSATIVVRSEAGAALVASALRGAVGSLDPDLPVVDVLPLDEAVAMELSVFAVFSGMFGLFASAALALATIGLSAVTAYAVTQRTREVGLRVALGARRGHVWWLITRRAAGQLGAGIALGLIGAFGAGQLLQAILFGVSARDPLTLAGVPAVVTVVALAASFLPARRAMRLDPAAALRAE